MADEPSSEIVPPPLPVPVRPRRERLPGTYAGNYLEADPHPNRGALIIGGFFALALLIEVFELFTAIFSGYSLEVDLSSLIRVGLISLTLILLWAGVGWVRWPLAALAFFVGLHLVIQTAAANAGFYSQPSGLPADRPLPTPMSLSHQIESILPIMHGLIYLGLSAYLVFSSNVAAFIRQQKEKESGKAISVAPVASLCGLLLLTLCLMRPLCMAWRDAEQQRAVAFGDESVRAITEHWDYKAFDARADADYAAQWPLEAQKSVFGSLSPLGSLQKMDEHSLNLHGTLDGKDGSGGLEWRGYYLGQGAFEHGHGTMTLELHRGLFSPWRIASWSFRRDPVAVPGS